MMQLRHPEDHIPEVRMWLDRMADKFSKVADHPKYKDWMKEHLWQSMLTGETAPVDHARLQKLISEITKELNLYDA